MGKNGHNNTSFWDLPYINIKGVMFQRASRHVSAKNIIVTPCRIPFNDQSLVIGRLPVTALLPGQRE